MFALAYGTKTSIYLNSSEPVFDFSENNEPGDVFGITAKQDGNVAVYKNGVSIFADIQVIHTLNLNGLLEETDSTASYNFGQQPFVYATDNGDGTVTLENTSPNMDQDWSDECWNDY